MYSDDELHAIFSALDPEHRLANISYIVLTHLMEMKKLIELVRAYEIFSAVCSMDFIECLEKYMLDINTVFEKQLAFARGEIDDFS